MQITTVAMDDEWIAIGRLASIVEKTHQTHIGVDYPDFSFKDKEWADDKNEPVSIQYVIKCVNSNTLVAKRALIDELQGYTNTLKGEITKWKTDYKVEHKYKASHQ